MGRCTVIVAGFGFRKAATVDSLQDAFAKAGGDATHLATLSEKSGAACVKAFRNALNLPLISVPQTDAKTQHTTTQSAVSLSTIGTGSVAEATALAAAGPNAVLTVQRVISSDGCATCAIAKGATP